MRRTIYMLVCLMLIATGCGSDSTGPEAARLTGSWSYNATGITGGGLSCSMTGLTLLLTHSGSSLSGTTAGGRMDCQAGTIVESFIVGAGTITNGSINGNVVTFSMGTTGAFRNTGTLSGNAITGQLVITLDQTVLAGNFTAIRQ